MTACGHIIREIRRMPEMNEEGVLGYNILFDPHSDLVEEYNLRKEVERHPNGYVSRWYPSTVVFDLRNDTYKGKSFISSTFDEFGNIQGVQSNEGYYNRDRSLIAVKFDGNDTSFSRTMLRGYREVIEDQQKHIRVLEARNAALWHKIKLMTSQEIEFQTIQSNIRESIKGGDSKQYEATPEGKSSYVNPGE